MFEYFNTAFGVEQFEANVKFISDKKTRKMFGSFRMWIDLQRLYLIMFLKMDRIDFQEDRIFFCLYRTMCFMSELFSGYEISDFEVDFLSEISVSLIKHTVWLQKVIPTYMQPLLRNIANIIPNFTQKKPLLNMKQKQQLRKQIFRKLCREEDQAPEIEHRIAHTTQFQTRQRQFAQITYVTESKQIMQMTKATNFVTNFDDKIRKQLQVQAQQRNKPFNESLYQQILQAHKEQLKEKPVTENLYQILKKTGHNPYDESNYAIYGQNLGINLENKENLEKEEVIHLIKQEVVNEHEIYYDEDFIERIKEMKVSDVHVTNDDLNFHMNSQEKESGYLYQDNSTKLKNVNWSRDDIGDPSRKQSQIQVKEEETEFLRGINLKKNLENNALFQRNDQQEKEKSLILLKKVLHKGLESNLLFSLQKKKAKVFNDMSEARMTSIQSQCVIDRNKFDSLRKVAQYNAINKKIQKWVNHNSNKLPNYYPRGIQEIRNYYVDSGYESQKIENAYIVAEMED